MLCHVLAVVFASTSLKTPHDKWRDWHPPKMHTVQEQVEIMKNGKHICEFTDKGPCADMVRIDKTTDTEYTEGDYE